MIIDTKIETRKYKNSNTKKILYFLVECDNHKCKKRKWYTNNKRKFCNKSCANGATKNFEGRKHTDESKKKIAKAGMGRKHLATTKMKMSISRSGEKNPFYGKKHTEESRELMSHTRTEMIASGKMNLSSMMFGIKGWYHSTKINEDFYYDSFWELIRMYILDKDKDVIFLTKRHGIKIQYEYDGNIKNYVPDFKIEYDDGIIMIEELKGYNERIQIKEAKFISLISYCNNNNFVYNIIQQNEMQMLCKKWFGVTSKALLARFKTYNSIFLPKHNEWLND